MAHGVLDTCGRRGPCQSGVWGVALLPRLAEKAGRIVSPSDGHTAAAGSKKEERYVEVDQARPERSHGTRELDRGRPGLTGGCRRSVSPRARGGHAGERDPS